LPQSSEVLKERAEHWQAELGAGFVIPGYSTVGGGSLPGETLPTHLLSLPVKSPTRVLKWLRNRPLPIIARIENDQVVFDPRTVLLDQEKTLLDELRQLISRENVLK